MPILPITQETWADINVLQNDVYHQIEPEPLEVLQDKWIKSPDLCFCYREDGLLLSYLLSHAWNSDTTPSLSELLPKDCAGPILFLHDLAVSTAAKGKGVGTRMVEHLLKKAQQGNFDKISLVSIQSSKAFWERHGFIEVPHDVSDSYGDDATYMERAL
ncbi:GNAT family N-acetyltransferase [Terasakiella pusilla]|uniref:GNAT family N-acetyltransferase n=1 Tax=Terasakiella pusilla TaxID=64973 RepID=UPI003AA7B935